MSQISQEMEPGREEQWTVVALGTFDGRAALALQERLSGMLQATRVLVDLHEVRDISDCALAVFAQWALKSCQGQVRLTGLSTHHQRLLRYICPSVESLCGPSDPLTEAEAVQ